MSQNQFDVLSTLAITQIPSGQLLTLTLYFYHLPCWKEIELFIIICVQHLDKKNPNFRAPERPTTHYFSKVLAEQLFKLV